MESNKGNAAMRPDTEAPEQPEGPERPAEYTEGHPHGHGEGGQHAQAQQAAQDPGPVPTPPHAGRGLAGGALQPPDNAAYAQERALATADDAGQNSKPLPLDDDGELSPTERRIVRELHGIKDVFNRMADAVDQLTAAVQQHGTDINTLDHKLNALQHRMDSTPQGGPDAAMVRELRERVEELEHRPTGPMDPIQQREHLEREMKKESARHAGERMLYHRELPPKVCRTAEDFADAEARGYKSTPLDAAGGDQDLAAAIHARAANSPFARPNGATRVG